jgi:hypothetical protein
MVRSIWRPTRARTAANPLLAFPLRGQQFTEPWVVHDERRVYSYDPEAVETPFVDHPVGANIYLEARWRHFFCYRVLGLHETDGHGAPPGRHTGLYLDEIVYPGTSGPPLTF